MEKISAFSAWFSANRIAPFFDALALIIAILLSPLTGMSTDHIFTEANPVPYSGATMEITSDYVIVKGASACAAENTAADKLDSYLEQICGMDFEVVTDDTAPVEKEIIVGKTNREGKGYTVDRETLGADGVYIKTVENKLILSGGEPRGALYAVYTFLEDYFDCHWFTATLTVIPHADKLLIPENIDYSYTPPFSFRQTDWISPSRSIEYKVANGLNTNVSGTPGEDMGGCVSYAGSFCHTMQYLIPTSLFEEDETLFALGVETGERTTDQPCLTNPKTLEIAIKNVRAWLDSSPDATIISVTQNDNDNYCVCDNCKAIDKEEGSHSGTMLRFANAIADNIKEDYPDVYVDTFAYDYTRTPCKITVPRDNVIVRLCSIECDFSTPLNGGKTMDNIRFSEDLEQWSKMAKNLFIWDYATCYSAYLSPFGNFDVLQPNMQFYAKNNVIGMYVEGNYEAAISDGEFAELKCYLISKLMWNPDCNVDELMYDFCKAYYGAGYQNVIDFINIMDKGYGCETDWNWGPGFVLPLYFEYERGLCIYLDPRTALPSVNTQYEYDEIDKLWEGAMDGAATDAEREHVERSELCWRYWKACRNVCEFSTRNEYARINANEELYNDFVRLNILTLAEGTRGRIVSNPDFTAIPLEWIVDP